MWPSGVLVMTFPLGALLAAASSAPPHATLRDACGQCRRIGAARRRLGACGGSPTVWLFNALLVLAGTIDAIVDSAQNVQGVIVEEWRGRSIMNSLHAIWSLGATVGGLIGTACAAAVIPYRPSSSSMDPVWALVALAAAHLPRRPTTPSAAQQESPEADGDAAAGVRTDRADARLSGPRPGACWPAGRAGHLRTRSRRSSRQQLGSAVRRSGDDRAGHHRRARFPPSSWPASSSAPARRSHDGSMGRNAVARRWPAHRRRRRRRDGPCPSRDSAGFCPHRSAGQRHWCPLPSLRPLGCPACPHGTGIAYLGWLMRLGFLVTSPLIGSSPRGRRFAPRSSCRSPQAPSPPPSPTDSPPGADPTLGHPRPRRPLVSPISTSSWTYCTHLGAAPTRDTYNPTTRLRTYFLCLRGTARLGIMTRPEVSQQAAQAPGDRPLRLG